MPAAAALLSATEKANAAFNTGAFWKKSSSSGGAVDVGDIGHSLRIRGSASAYLSRTFSSAGSDIWTYSIWLKRTTSGLFQCLFMSGNGPADYSYLVFNADDTITFNQPRSGSGHGSVTTTSVFRDPTSWYNIIVSYNGGSNICDLYVNGALASTTGTVSGAYSYINEARNHFIAHAAYGGMANDGQLDGYISRVCFVDGQALTPSSFGYLNTNINEWVSKTQSQVKTVVDAGGTNSFMLDFDDAAFATYNVGKDFSAKGNHWTPNNISLTAGSTYDWMLDVPGNSYPTINSNYPTSDVITQAGLYINHNGASAVDRIACTSWTITSGKWYWEFANLSGNSAAYDWFHSGVATETQARSGINVAHATYNTLSGSTVWASTAPAGNGTTNSIRVCFDADAGKLWTSNTDGTWYNAGDPVTGANPIFSGIPTQVVPCIHTYSNGVVYDQGTVNFGQRPFTYTPPTGYKALCQKNLPDPTIPKPSLHFDVKTYTGTGTLQAIGSNPFYKLTYAYNISKSLRFNSASPEYLLKNFSTAMTGNGQTWTLSLWVKRGSINGNGQNICGSRNGGTGPFFQLGFMTNSGLQADTLTVGQSNGGSWIGQLVTNTIYRDFTKWIHITLRLDTTHGTSSERLKLYVDGVQCTSFSSTTYPNLNDAWSFGYNGYNTAIGCIYQASAVYGFDGNIAEINFIDGQALTPDSFGQWDSTGTTWIPKSYTGTYGANGFYLDFSTGTSQATLGYDKAALSGAHTAANNWTLNNFTPGTPGSLGVNEMWMSDTPTNNFCTFHPDLANAQTNSYGNLNWSASSGAGSASSANICMTSGKWYWEVIASTGGNQIYVGVALGATRYYYYSDGRKFDNSFYSYGNAFSNGNVIGVKFDRDAGTLEFLLDNVSQGVAFTGLTTTNMYPNINNNGTSSSTGTINFGQRPFVYTIPAGYNTLCTTNAPSPATTAWMPSLAIIKSRTNAYDWCWSDSLRGAFMGLATNSSNAQTTNTNTVQKFFPGGIQVGGDNTTGASSNNYVSYLWKGGTPAANSAGSNGATISSIYSVNTSAGFGVVLYTGLAATATVYHGLGITPKFIISKAINADNWMVYHADLGVNKYIYLDLSSAAGTIANYWGSTTPTTTTLGLPNGAYSNNTTQPHTSYFFGEVAGYSKIGSYTGNGSTDGPFVWCGFKPKFILLKNTNYDNTQYWVIHDSTRSTYNVCNTTFLPNSANAESTSAGADLDILSNGFKIRNSNTVSNASGYTIIFIAFADVPAKYANAR